MSLSLFSRCLASVWLLLCLCANGILYAQNNAQTTTRPRPDPTKVPPLPPMTVPRDQASLVVSWPYDGSVFQRNASSTGTFVVEGSLNSYYVKTSDYEFEVTLVPLYLTTGRSDGSKSAIYSPLVKAAGGYGFRIPMENVPAGWYNMSVTGYPLARDLPTYYGSSRKVGIGEVFVISGQSNAQGLANQTNDLNVAYPLPSYDAVRVQPNAVNPSDFIDFSYTRSVDAVRKEYLTPTVAAKDVATNQGIAPAGGSLWYWARVGERLAAQYNVPIAFYNAAFGGTSIKNWAGSKDGQGEPLGQPGANPPTFSRGAPYLLLRKSLNLYGSSFGVRSVLWLQGETDVRALTDNWGTERTIANATDYSNLLQAVIQQSRQDFGKPVPWVIGKTSYFTITNNYGGPSPGNSNTVRNGQSLAVSTAAANGLGQVFEGPDTDASVTARRTGDEIHFGRRDANNSNGSDGLAQAANAWFDNLNSLLANPNTIVPVTVDGTSTLPQLLSISDDGTTATTLPGYTTQWVQDNGTGFDLANTVATSIAFSGTGTYRAVMTNGQGNRIVTQTVQLPFRVVNDVQTPTDACSSFTEGTEVAYRNIGDPNVKVVVRQRGACKYAVWSDGSEDMPYDWMPYVNTIGSFTKADMRQCLKFNGESCGTTAPACTFSPTVSSNVATPSCGQGIQLTAGCNGADCGGVNYSWSGNGISGSGTTVSFNVPNANGSFTYTLTASKAGCNNQSANLTFSLSGCGGGPDCSIYTDGAQVAYRAVGDPNVKVVVQARGGCKYAVWSNTDGDTPRDWLPYITANPGFSTTTMGQCLKFAGDACGARLAAQEPTETVELGLRIAPNPSNGRFTVHFQTKPGEKASLRLVDLTGRAVRATQFITGTGGEHTEAIVLPGSVRGVLIVEVVSGGQRASQKVLIE